MFVVSVCAGYTLLTSFTEACDGGMCCAWNQHGTLFASCHQDGAVAVWDARSGRCISRMALANAARCIKFSAAPMDMLAVSEHDASVVLVDSRAWHMRQTVLVPPGPHQGSPGGRGMDISGLAFTPSGSRLWVGMDTCCVGVQIDSVKRRTFGVSSVL
jgi:WD40 repeat protein